MPSEAAPFAYASMRARLWCLAQLTVAGMAGIYARTALGSLQETLQRDLTLSDHQIAILQGPALALPILIGAVPLGLLVDRISRVRILLVATSVCLIGTFLAAAAQSFTLLLAARCLIGIAAPATAVTIYSLLGDLFDPTERGRATMTVLLGQIAGSSVAFMAGAFLLGHFGGDLQAWRPALASMAILLAPVVFATLWMREPPRTGAIAERPRIRDVWPELWRYRRIIAALVAGATVVNLADGAALVWALPTLVRSFELAPERAGAVMGMILLAGGLAGPVLGGVLADFCQRMGGPQWTLRALGSVALLSAPAGMFALMPAVETAAIALAVFLAAGGAVSVMVTALTIVVIPNELRGICVTVKWAAGATVGLGLAPAIVSLISDALGGPAKVGDALAIVCASTSVLAAIAFVYPRGFSTATNAKRDFTLPVDRRVTGDVTPE